MLANLKNVIKTGSGKAKGGYSAIDNDSLQKAADALQDVSNGASVGMSARQRGSAMGHWAMGNLQQAAFKGGHSSVLGMAGSHAIRGAAWGGVIGGTMEAAQGGSFWDGAKQGAFNGAAGWTGYRMGMKATGASSLNPFGKGGIGNSATNMWRSTGGADAQVSKQAVALLSNRQREGLARAVMNGNKKAAAQSGM